MRTELVGEPAAAGDARRLVRETLRRWQLEHLDDAATLLVSEVVTNAVLHARTDLAVELELRDDAVRVTVSDGSPTVPSPRRYDLEASTGRGVRLVVALASAWGTEPCRTPWRKKVWFELPTDPRALASVERAVLQPG